MKRFFMVGVFIAGLSGCAYTGAHLPPETSLPEASLAASTTTEKLLRELPPPSKPLVVAVYEFLDQTGQQKPADIPQYSRAVTQGGVAILKKALIDAGTHRWFRVVERGNLNALLQERKIVRAMRQEYAGPNGDKLPALDPMLYAGLIIEGGIVAYDSNVMSGGIGARYLGIGGSTKYSRDMVTVYLRLVSVSSGEVLLSVNTSKTIFSTSLSGGVFKFVSYDDLLEGETGVTYNEPPQLAVRQAIELGVYALVMEGYRNNLWAFSSADSGNTAFARYHDRYLKGRPEADLPGAKTEASLPRPLPESNAGQSSDASLSSLAGSYHPGAERAVVVPAAKTNAQPPKSPLTLAAAVNELCPSSGAGNSEEAFDECSLPIKAASEGEYLAQALTILLERHRAAQAAGAPVGVLTVFVAILYEKQGALSEATQWYEKGAALLAESGSAKAARIRQVAKARLEALRPLGMPRREAAPKKPQAFSA